MNSLTLLNPATRILDSRTFGVSTGRLGDARPGDDGYRTISVPNSGGKLAAEITLTAVDPRPGYITVWPTGSKPIVSALNMTGIEAAIANTTTVQLSQGRFRLFVRGDSHVLIDLIGLWS